MEGGARGGNSFDHIVVVVADDKQNDPSFGVLLLAPSLPRTLPCRALLAAPSLSPTPTCCALTLTPSHYPLSSFFVVRLIPLPPPISQHPHLSPTPPAAPDFGPLLYLLPHLAALQPLTPSPSPTPTSIPQHPSLSPTPSCHTLPLRSRAPSWRGPSRSIITPAAWHQMTRLTRPPSSGRTAAAVRGAWRWLRWQRGRQQQQQLQQEEAV